MRIATRKSWKARRPRAGLDRQSDQRITELFLHHPADVHDLAHIDRDQEQDAYMRGIQNFHMDSRGWGDFAYNFAVFQDGEVYRGRGRNVVPAAQFGHNTGTVAVLCVLGDNETPTPEMHRALRNLKNYLDGKVGRDLRVRAHGDVFATSCPGPKLRRLIPQLNRS